MVVVWAEKLQLGIYRLDGTVLLKLVLKKECGGYNDWIGLYEYTEKWWAVVSTVMNIWVCKMRGIP